jgi:glycosyltransferase involved in cell wall biosynthesis
MKIVHIVATATGAPWMIALAREQKKLGHKVAAILPSLDGNIAPDLARHGIESHAAPTEGILSRRSPVAKLRAIVQLARLLRRLRPDVVHSHIFPAVITSRLASWLADVPIHLGGNVHPLSLESDVMRPLEIGTAFCDTRTIASSTYTRELYVRYGLPPEQVALIFYAVDQSGHDPVLVDGNVVRRELGIGENTPVIGKIAYFYPPPRTGVAVPPLLRGRGIKGHDVLLRAIPQVLATIPDAKFIIVGRGWGADGPAYEQALHDLAITLKINDAICWTGERADVPAVLAAFDVSVHCSLSENNGGTVESLLMAKPMVVSDIGGFTDTIVHEETGLVVPAGDPQALAEAIVRLLRDGELARRLGAAGRTRMLAGFTLAHTVAALEALLTTLSAEQTEGYRITRTIARTIAAPFRLLPIALAVRRAVRAGRS